MYIDEYKIIQNKLYFSIAILELQCYYNSVVRNNNCFNRKKSISMSLLAKFNENRPFSDVDTTGLQYMGLNDLYEQFGADHVYTLKGLFINGKGKFGAEPVAILENCLVNIPRHQLDEVTAMIDDDGIVNGIKKGQGKFKIVTYTNKFSKKGKKFYEAYWL